MILCPRVRFSGLYTLALIVLWSYRGSFGVYSSGGVHVLHVSCCLYQDLLSFFRCRFHGVIEFLGNSYGVGVDIGIQCLYNLHYESIVTCAHGLSDDIYIDAITHLYVRGNGVQITPTGPVGEYSRKQIVLYLD